MRVNLNKRERLLVTVLVALLVLAAGWRFAYLPLSKSYAAAAAQLRAGQAQLGAARQKASSLGAQGGRTEQAKVNYDAATVRFAAELQDGGMLVKFGQKAQADGIKITYWQPGPVVDEKSYIEVPVKAEVKGPYSGILPFLNALETHAIEPNLVDIRQLELTTLSPDSSSGGTTAATSPATSPGTGSATGPATGPATDQSTVGEVDAKLVLVFYSETKPTEHLAVPEIVAWSQGRTNPFVPAGMVSPYPGVVPQGAPPPSDTSGEAAPGQGGAGGTSPGVLPALPGAGPQSSVTSAQIRGALAGLSSARLQTLWSEFWQAKSAGNGGQRYIDVWAN